VRKATRRCVLKLIGTEGPLLAFLYRKRLLGALLSYDDLWTDAGLHRLVPKLSSLTLMKEEKSEVAFEAVVQLLHKKKLRATLTQRIEVRYASVTLTSTATIAPKAWAKLTSLARIGLVFSLPAAASKAKWLGRGPHENYADRNKGAPVGLYESSVDALHFPYIFPQENGHRTETRWLTLSDDDGSGLRVSASGGTPSFGFNASRYTTATLAAAKHTPDLSPSPSVELCVDERMMGVGGDSAAMQTVKKEYECRPEGGRASWEVRLTAFVGGEHV